MYDSRIFVILAILLLKELMVETNDMTNMLKATRVKGDDDESYDQTDEIKDLKRKVASLQREIENKSSTPGWLIVLIVMLPIIAVGTYHFFLHHQLHPKSGPAPGKIEGRVIMKTSKYKDTTTPVQNVGAKVVRKSPPMGRVVRQQQHLNKQLHRNKVIQREVDGERATRRIVRTRVLEPPDPSHVAIEEKVADPEDVHRVIIGNVPIAEQTAEDEVTMSTSVDPDGEKFIDKVRLNSERPKRALTLRERNPVVASIRDKLVTEDIVSPPVDQTKYLQRRQSRVGSRIEPRTTVRSRPTPSVFDPETYERRSAGRPNNLELDSTPVSVFTPNSSFGDRESRGSSSRRGSLSL